MRLILGVQSALVPDVPLIEGDVHLVAVLACGLDGVDGGDHAVDEGVHIHTLGQEGGGVAVVLLVVGVHGDVVHLFVGVGEHSVLPRAEGGHLPVGGADGDQLDAVVHQLHRLGRLLGQTAVFVSRLVPDLPRPVQLVAQAPELDVEGVLLGAGGRAVLPAQIRPVGAAGVVGVLHQGPGLVDAAGAQVDRLHHLDLSFPGPLHELVEAESVGLEGVPGAVDADRTVLHGPDAVLPVVAGDEVAAGVADHSGAHLTHQLQHVLAEAAGVSLGMPRLVDPGVYTAAHMLHEGAEEPAGDLRHGEVPVNGDACLRHESPLSQ